MSQEVLSHAWKQHLALLIFIVYVCLYPLRRVAFAFPSPSVPFLLLVFLLKRKKNDLSAVIQTLFRKCLLSPFLLLQLSKLRFQNVTEKRFELRVQNLAASGTTLMPLLPEDRTLPDPPLLGLIFYFSNRYREKKNIWLFVTVPAVSGSKQFWEKRSTNRFT